MKAREVIRVLRFLADLIEKHPELVEKYGEAYDDYEEIEDLFSLYAKGREQLEDYLNGCDAKKLKGIIRSYHLDRIGKTARWRKKERLIEFIVEKIGEFYKKGSVFK